MHFLRTVEIPGLGDFIDRVCEIPITQGVIVDINPIWLAAYRMAQAGLDPSAIETYILYGWPSGLDVWTGTNHDREWVFDLGWKNGFVEHWCDRLFNKPKAPFPFLVKVAAFPLIDPALIPA